MEVLPAAACRSGVALQGRSPRVNLRGETVQFQDLPRRLTVLWAHALIGVRSTVELMIHVPDEVRYRLLTYLEQHPEASQRELAEVLGMSLGKVNYCINALIRRGLVKMRNFRKSTNKLAYMYVLTPQGIEEKLSVTHAFLRRRVAEYEAIAQEIDRLTNELRGVDSKMGEASPVE
jgi:EPS-associated MarR family transcriptional regulator